MIQRNRTLILRRAGRRKGASVYWDVRRHWWLIARGFVSTGLTGRLINTDQSQGGVSSRWRSDGSGRQNGRWGQGEVIAFQMGHAPNKHAEGEVIGGHPL